MIRKLYGLLVIAVIVLCSCQSKVEPTPTQSQDKPTAQPTEVELATLQKEETMSIKLTSTAFEEGDMIPKQYTCEGNDTSPPLAWTGVPDGAKSLALITNDPDAPAGDWVHWIIFNIPPNVTELPESIPANETVPGGGTHGKNSWGRLGYGGPCPPSGTHRYVFKLYALDTELNLKIGATKKDVENAMKGHVLAEGQLMGKYKRS